MEEFGFVKKERRISRAKAAVNLLYFPLTILFYEAVTAFCTFGGIRGWSLVYTAMFSLSAGFFLHGVTALIPKKGRYVVTIVLTALFILVFGVQIVY